jgi:hypothetical protein
MPRFIRTAFPGVLAKPTFGICTRFTADIVPVGISGLRMLLVLSLGKKPGN